MCIFRVLKIDASRSKGVLILNSKEKSLADFFIQVHHIRPLPLMFARKIHVQLVSKLSLLINRLPFQTWILQLIYWFWDTCALCCMFLQTTFSDLFSHNHLRCARNGIIQPISIIQWIDMYWALVQTHLMSKKYMSNNTVMTSVWNFAVFCEQTILAGVGDLFQCSICLIAEALACRNIMVSSTSVFVLLVRFTDTTHESRAQIMCLSIGSNPTQAHNFTKHQWQSCVRKCM